MDSSSIDTLSLKLVRIIKTRDPDKVGYWVRQLENQKNQLLVAHLMASVNHRLQRQDRDLYQWFREFYLADYSPEVKQLWLDFVDLCSLSL